MFFYKKIIIIFILILVSILNIAFSAPVKNNFSGVWCWDKNSNVSVFSIKINNIGGKYIGGYDAVALSGNRIDDNERAFSFNITKKNPIKTHIKAGISGNIGLIQLRLLSSKKIEWTILQNPKGEFYAPSKAILHKC